MSRKEGLDFILVLAVARFARHAGNLDKALNIGCTRDVVAAAVDLMVGPVWIAVSHDSSYAMGSNDIG